MRGNAIYLFVGLFILGLVALWIFRPGGPTFTRRSSASRIQRRQRLPRFEAAVGAGDERVAALRRELLTKLSHDEAAAERIVDGLQRKLPGVSSAAIYERAIQDWLNDNNRS